MRTTRNILALAGLAAFAAWGVAGARRSRPLNLRGQVVMVTGGSRGLGLCIARELASHGARLALIARDAEELQRARKDLEAEYEDVEVLVLPCDVTHPEQVERAVRATQSRFGRVDGLVNVAGIIQVGPLEAMDLEDFQQIMDVNFYGALHAIMAVLPSMKVRKRGFIVNIDSIGGRITVPHLLPYHASKFALRGLSEGLSVELAKHNIAVTTVLPGLMRTGSPVNALFKGSFAKEFAWFGFEDSMPGLSLSAPEAARQVVEALRYGKREVVLGLFAKVGGLVHDVLPGATIAILELMDRVLPQHEGEPTESVRGINLRTTFIGPLVETVEGIGKRYNEV